MSAELPDKDEICDLIPHAGSMCLIDKVLHWDEKHITCCSYSHQDPDNPLLKKGTLSATALVEYGAQAMAIHGGLLAKYSGEAMKEGYLAALRNVIIDVDVDVTSIKTSLSIEAIQQMSSQGNMIYNFSVNAGEKLLASGRATVVAVFQE